MWALLTVLMGWTVSQWKASLPGAVTTPPVVPGNPGVPVHRAGSRTLAYNASQPVMVGTDVQLFQKWVGITADGYFGPNTREAAMRYQRMRGIVADGIVGPITWAPILAALRMT